MDDPAHANYDFFFIFGSDLLEGLKRWDDGERLVSEIKFIIFVRIGYGLKEEFLPRQYIIVHATFVASSSSEIRNRIAALRNQGTLEVTDPKLKRRMSIDENPTKMKEINVSDSKLRTIEGSANSVQDCVSVIRNQIEKKYLGIYGIVPSSIIEYIKEKELYVFKEKEKKKDQKL